MSKVIFLMGAIFLTACTDYTGEVRTQLNEKKMCPTKGHQTKVANFTLECIKNANPKSDEEPEDWLRICRSMAVDTYCHYIQVKQTQVCDASGLHNCISWRTVKTEVVE